MPAAQPYTAPPDAYTRAWLLEASVRAPCGPHGGELGAGLDGELDDAAEDPHEHSTTANTGSRTRSLTDPSLRRGRGAGK